MLHYYYSVGRDQFGPFTIEELKEKKLAPDTLIWHDRLKDWIEASEIDELSMQFQPIKPLIQQDIQQDARELKKKKNKKQFVKMLLLTLVIITIAVAGGVCKDIFFG